MTARPLRDVICKAQQKLRYYNIMNADDDARILCEWASHTIRMDYVLRPDMLISGDKIEKLDSALARRIKGEPVYRIIGTREFYGIPFSLSKDTLEPRADTETLVDIILPILQQIIKIKDNVTFLDMGTGTGAIAIAALTYCNEAKAVGVDIATGALKTAQENALAAGVNKRFSTLASNWFEKVDNQYDLIVSNPPYIAQKDMETLSIEVRDHDPICALTDGADGLEFYRKLAKESTTYLHKKGYVGVEIGIGQENDVIELFANQNFKCIEIRHDLAGIARALLFVINQ